MHLQANPIRRLREAMGHVSQESLAHQFGLATRTILRWEKDPFAIPTDALAEFYIFAVKSGEKDIASDFQALLNLRFEQALQRVEHMRRAAEFTRENLSKLAMSEAPADKAILKSLLKQFSGKGKATK